jgi:hypothetical protein
MVFGGEDPVVPIRPPHNMTGANIRLVRAADGFAIDGVSHVLPWHHFVVFKRAAAGQ